MKELLAGYLDPLELGAWQYHPVVGSTNDLALDWAKDGAPDWSLALADEQTTGRGRGDRHWVTRPGAALAMSLILRPSAGETAYFTRFTALAALGLINALEGLGLTGAVKWPNDILLQEKKVAGVLVEADWGVDSLPSVVVGMGVNITPDAVPNAEELRYPAISVEDAADEPVDRWALLSDILLAMKKLRTTLTEDAFISAWEARLAFLGEWVIFQPPGGDAHRVKILGVTREGRLGCERLDGQRVNMVAGEILMPYN